MDLPARVGETGAILLGNLVEVDGFAERPFRVITHIHSDHVLGFSKSKKHATFIVGTPATLEALEVLGMRVPPDKALPLQYGEPVKLIDETLVLQESRHVLGSCQVLLETSSGERVGYTSDFKFPGTKIMKGLDVLVIDATYGDTSMRRPFKHEVPQLFADLVLDELSRGMPVRVLGFHGKLQEAMEVLRTHGVDAPFIMPRKIYELTKISVKYGMKIKDFYLEGTRKAAEIIREGWYVLFHHVNSHRNPSVRITDIYLTGWIFDEPIKVLNNSLRRKAFAVGFSDHGDFDDTIAYVEEACPKLLVVDGYRASMHVAMKFAREVEKRIGIKTVVMPLKEEGMRVFED